MFSWIRRTPDGGGGSGEARERATAAARLGREDQAELPGLIHPAQLAGFAGTGQRNLVAEGHVHFGDEQVARRYWAHNEALAWRGEHAPEARLSRFGDGGQSR